MSIAEGRKFGLTVGPAFAVLAGILWWRHKPTGVIGGFGALAVLLVVTALLTPRLLFPVQKAWMRFAELLSRVTTPIVMAILFYLVFFPIGLLMRASGKNPLRQAPSSTTAWVPRAAGSRRSELRRQF